MGSLLPSAEGEKVPKADEGSPCGNHAHWSSQSQRRSLPRVDPFAPQPLFDGSRGLVVLEVEERALDFAILGERDAEGVPVAEGVSELVAHRRRRHLLEEQAPVFYFALRGARGDAQVALAGAGWLVVERLIDDVARLEVEVVGASATPR